MGTRSARGALLAAALAVGTAIPAAGVEAQVVSRPGVGPYDLPLYAAASSPGASGEARLLFASSPFGIAVTPDGHSIYDLEVTTKGLPAPSSLGAYSTYFAWAVATDLTEWVPLGPVHDGTTTVGPVQLDKFLVVITAEASESPVSRAGPTVLHGSSPSSWLQSFLNHPLFRNVQ